MYTNKPSQNDNNFVILIDGLPSWECLSSVFSQTYTKFRVVILNTESEDTKSLHNFITSWSMTEKVTFGEGEINDNDVICTIGKDDWLLNDSVLLYLNANLGTEMCTYCNSYYTNHDNKVTVTKNGVYPLYTLRGHIWNNRSSDNISEIISKSYCKILFQSFYVKNEKTKFSDNFENIVGDRLEFIDEIILINLKGRYDRKLFMKYKLKDINLQCKIWTAEDGKLEKNRKLYEEYRKNSYNPVINSSGAYSLLLTYKNIVNYCLEKQYNKVLLLEDDIYFINNFRKRLENLKDLFNKNDIIYLGANQNNFTSDQLEEMQLKSFYTVSKNVVCYGTYGICLSKNILEKLKVYLNDINKSNKTIDYLIWSLKVDSIVLFPNLVIPEVRESDNMGSRSLVEMAKERKWDLRKYSHIKLFKDFVSSYKKVHEMGVVNNKLVLDDINSFVFIIPSYNNSKWYKKNITSVLEQKYPFWRIIYVDDCSTDNTFELVSEFIHNNRLSGRVTVLRNEKRMFQAYSRYKAYTKMVDDNEICCFLDGDDWLFNSDVLTHLNFIYSKGYNCTYGRFTTYEQDTYSPPKGIYEFPEEVRQNKTYRKYPWITQHLRTCRCYLIKDIPVNHLQDFNGKWLDYCTDLAEMFWVLEKDDCRHTNAKKVLYVYNKDNSIQYSNSFYREENLVYKQKVESYIRNLKYT